MPARQCKRCKRRGSSYDMSYSAGGWLCRYACKPRTWEEVRELDRAAHARADEARAARRRERDLRDAEDTEKGLEFNPMTHHLTDPAAVNDLLGVSLERDNPPGPFSSNMEGREVRKVARELSLQVLDRPINNEPNLDGLAIPPHITRDMLFKHGKGPLIEDAWRKGFVQFRREGGVGKKAEKSMNVLALAAGWTPPPPPPSTGKKGKGKGKGKGVPGDDRPDARDQWAPAKPPKRERMVFCVYHNKNKGALVPVSKMRALFQMEGDEDEYGCCKDCTY